MMWQILKLKDSSDKILRVSLSLIVKTAVWWEELAWLDTAENLNLTLPAPIPEEEKK